MEKIYDFDDNENFEKLHILFNSFSGMGQTGSRHVLISESVNKIKSHYADRSKYRTRCSSIGRYYTFIINNIYYDNVTQYNRA